MIVNLVPGKPYLVAQESHPGTWDQVDSYEDQNEALRAARAVAMTLDVPTVVYEVRTVATVNPDLLRRMAPRWKDDNGS